MATINTEIKTKLSFRDVALIAAALEHYQKIVKPDADPECKQRAKNLCDRLGSEIYAYPKNDFTE